MNPTTTPKAREIQTLPPLPILQKQDVLSPRTGEPKRVVSVTIGHVLLQLSIVGIAVAYGWHWFRAVYPQTYFISARLIEYLQPAPGKWLSLLLEGLIAALVALTAGICGVAGFHAWNGWRWSRLVALCGVALQGAMTLLVSNLALAGLIPAILGTVLLWLPPTSRFFDAFARQRIPKLAPYRRPDSIYYGRLPRFR